MWNWCVVGLGNPGAAYQASRHNVGYLFIDRLCQKLGTRLQYRDPLMCWGEGSLAGVSLLLVKPLTYMNRSGIAVKALVDRYGCVTDRLLVVHDDMDLDLGRIRFKQKGGDGGHKGIRSILETLGQDRFLRLRIGIGRPRGDMQASDYVLGPFEADQAAVIEEVLDEAVYAFEVLICEGIEKAMSRFHAFKLPMGPEGGGRGGCQIQSKGQVVDERNVKRDSRNGIPRDP